MKRPIRWYWALAASCAAFVACLSVSDRLFWGAASLPYGLLGSWIPALNDAGNAVLGDEYGWTATSTLTDLPAFVAGVLVWAWLRRCPPVDHYPRCRKCGYNLTGNVSGRCPECGTPTSVVHGDARSAG